MDIASRALVDPLSDGIPDTFPAQVAHFNVPLATFYARASGRSSREAKAVDQKYLYPYEEKAVSDFLAQCGILGQPVRVKYIPTIAFSATCYRPEVDRLPKPPYYSWAKRFEKRRIELVIRKNKP